MPDHVVETISSPLLSHSIYPLRQRSEEDNGYTYALQISTASLQFIVHIKRRSVFGEQARISVDGAQRTGNSYVSPTAYEGSVISFSQIEVSDHDTNEVHATKGDGEELGWASLLFYDSNGWPSDVPTDHFQGNLVLRENSWAIELSNDNSSIQIVTRKSKRATEETTELNQSHSHSHRDSDSDSRKQLTDQQQSDNQSGSSSNNPNPNPPPPSFLPSSPSPLIQKPPKISCPSPRKILYMGIAADCTFTTRQGGVDPSIRTILSLFNAISLLYERTFNVSLAILDVLVYTDCQQNNGLTWNQSCNSTYGMEDRLSDFSKWRGLTRGSECGLWHLLTGCNTLPLLGLSWVGMICQGNVYKNRDGRYVSGVGVSSTAGSLSEFQVIAHEVGHNFGASHDCMAGCDCNGAGCRACCPCPTNDDIPEKGCDCKQKYLMNPSSDSKSNEFSPCTKQEICLNLASLTPSCLVDFEEAQKNSNSKLYTGQICGNGIKEGSEECDCGNAIQCIDNPCCNPDCTLKKGAACSDNNQNCCKNCQIANKGVICRTAISDCDEDEICTGQSADCPLDLVKPDGVKCGSAGDNAFCASGICTSRDLQCKQAARRYFSTGECQNLAGTNATCAMNCQTKKGCVSLASNYMDGTKCAYGMCYKGACKVMPSSTNENNQTPSSFTLGPSSGSQDSLFGNSSGMEPRFIILTAVLSVLGLIVICALIAVRIVIVRKNQQKKLLISYPQ